ncbi:hypothetical protein GCM10027589_13350 [Actinocorallia lasiicapitis]
MRSGDSVGLEQELWALLTTYQLLRIAIAIEQTPNANLDRAGFTIALTTAQDLLIKAENIHDDLDPIGRAVLTDLAPPRRLRVSTRKVKSALSRYDCEDVGVSPRAVV